MSYKTELQSNNSDLQSILDAVNALPDAGGTYQSKNVTPSSATQYITADSGYDALSQVVVAGDSDLVAANIAEGVSIFGVTGTLTEGVKVATGTVTLSDTISKTATVDGLGFTPSRVILLGLSFYYSTTSYAYLTSLDTGVTAGMAGITDPAEVWGYQNNSYYAYVGYRSVSAYDSVVTFTDGGFSVTLGKLSCRVYTSTSVRELYFYKGFHYIAIG